MARTGIVAIRGEQRNGLYHMLPQQNKTLSMRSLLPSLPDPPVAVQSTSQHRVLYTNAVPTSKFEHLHASLGHPGAEGMAWHRKHTPGADYTDADANAPRGLCSGCVLGGMRQASTNHRRNHRPLPTRPGQQFALDAFTCTTMSRQGNKHCDIYTDLLTKCRYPLFTKNRSALEIVTKTNALFNQHPEWKAGNIDRYFLFNTDNDAEPPDSRFIRVDAERNYSSMEFLACAAEHRYTLERTPPRDKHANGIAERSVGLITLKTNVIMLTPSPPVPVFLWDNAMDYACQTTSFNLVKSLKTSPYTFINKVPVPLDVLQPFWTPCYVHHDQKNSWARSGTPAPLRPVW